MNSKIVATHSSPFKPAGVRALLERIAAIEAVARVIPGRMARTASGGRPRLADGGIVAGHSGRKFTVVADGVSLELFIVPVAGRQAELEQAIAHLPEYVALGGRRRQAEAEAATARAARLAEARRHHGPRTRRV